MSLHQECGLSFLDRLPNSHSHFEKAGWVRDYVDVDMTLISSTDLVTLAS